MLCVLGDLYGNIIRVVGLFNTEEPSGKTLNLQKPEGLVNCPSHLFLILAPKHFLLFSQRLFTESLFSLLLWNPCVETNTLMLIDIPQYRKIEGGIESIKDFKNRMRFYIYVAVFLNRIQFFPNSLYKRVFCSNTKILANKRINFVNESHLFLRVKLQLRPTRQRHENRLYIKHHDCLELKYLS